MTARSPIEQTFFNISVLVGVVPTPLASSLDIGSLITSIIISNPSTNANSIFIGDQNVSLTTGVELVVGSAPILSIRQERQLYELQDPTLLTSQAVLCQPLDPVQIPFVVWDPSRIYFIAAAPTTIGVMLFRNVYM